ncbi:hypothetical protein [Humisphaera borealis]|uniref:Uncharacterized protein n=1 Tax=Humisphaera borealis TaxID=2807512 RepID=A0A7M2WZF0_9BACT|nr:hypothetical protein [Humisphaera borealis]QOV90897.1 hypothetical protein IPV69_05925 [Humisphaera borealis]
MTDANQPPAGGIDAKALQDAITASVTSSLTAALKPLQDQMLALQQQAQAKPAPAPTAAGKADAGEKPLTAAEVQKLLADGLAAHSQQSQQSAAREQYLGSKLKDLPEAYRKQLGNDPTKWPAEEQAIRSAYQADFKVAGGTVTDKGGVDAGGKKPGDTIDVTKLSATESIALGLKSSAPARSAPAPAVTEAK